MYNPWFPTEDDLNHWLDRFFGLSQHQTTVRREVLAGLTTFFTMAYIVAVNPAILANAGMPTDASVTATILTAIFGTLVMGLYAKRPLLALTWARTHSSPSP
jgi:AGZA family xanthine/uracil permease-like MFS transporter